MMNTTVTRSISGIAFILIMLGGLLFNRFLFAALVVFIMIAGMTEFYKITLDGKCMWARKLSIFSGVLFFVLLFAHYTFNLPVKYVFIAILPTMLVMVLSTFNSKSEEFGAYAFIYAGLLYIAIPLGLLNLITFNQQGDYSGTLLLCFFAIIWCSDVGAYVIGLSLGRGTKKLCPSVSPNKTWVGVYGGLSFAVLIALILHWCGLLLPGSSILHPIILAVLMDVSGVFGDLYESQWKRWKGVKDSGNIIPAHGGILDRFDSTLFAIPVGAIYLSLIGLL